MNGFRKTCSWPGKTVEVWIDRLNRALTPRTGVLIPVVCFLAVVLIQMLVILHLNNGVFTYSLDDAYIHLSLAEQIAHGHYGINEGEFSSPSSSILWPFLLAPFAGLSWFVMVPFWVNLIASIITLMRLGRFFLRLFSPFRRQNRLLAMLAGLFMILAGNMTGLLFCGMEHSLQLLLAVLIVSKMVDFCRSGTCSWGFPLILIVAPLIRYEMLALCVPALWILCRRGRWRMAVWVSVGIAAEFIIFAGFLHFLGLGLFPNSVAAKSEIVSSGGAVVRIFRNVVHGLCEKRGRGIFLFVLFLFALGTRFTTTRKSTALLCEWILPAIGLHFLFGQFGWFSRYEIYIWVAAVMTSMFLAAQKARQALSQSVSLVPAVVLTVFFTITSLAYLYAMVMTPIAANNIYEQQFQIRRFLTGFYKKPIAINDIGLPSLNHSIYVLDIWGLASKTALEHRLEDPTNVWMSQMAAQKGIDLAVVYDTGNLPEDWIPLAEWTLSRRRITPANATVTVFSLDSAACPMQRKVLFQFFQTLPPGVTWRWL